MSPRGLGYRANRTLSALSRFFNWLVARDVLATSPAAGVERPHKEEARTRILNGVELRAVWLACEDEGPSGQALRLTILTGTRRSEAAELPWSEIDDDEQVSSCRPIAPKTGRRATSLKLAGAGMIEACPRFAGCPFVFSVGGKSGKRRDAVERKSALEPESLRTAGACMICAGLVPAASSAWASQFRSLRRRSITRAVFLGASFLRIELTIMPTRSALRFSGGPIA